MLNCGNSYKLFRAAVVIANGYSVVAASVERGELTNFLYFEHFIKKLTSYNQTNNKNI
jgi:hypothetical protein